MSTSYLRSCVSYASESGIAVSQVLAAFAISEAQLQDDNHCIDVARLDAGFAQLEQRTGDAHIGLHIGQHMTPAHLGVLGLLLMTCKRTGELFDLHSRYGRLISNATWPEYSVRDGLFCMTLHDLEGQEKLSRHRTEYSLVGWLRLARWIMDETFELVRLEVTYSNSDGDNALMEAAGCPVQFDCAVTRIYFPAAYEDQALEHAPSRLRQMLELEAHQRLLELQGNQQEADPLLAEIRQVIAKQLMHGMPEISLVADQFGESVRSLQRKLEARDTCFSRLVDLVRIEMAQRYMQDTELSLAEVALLLGFSEQSAFQRAFKRWFNLTPGEYRRQHLRLQNGLNRPS